MRFHLWALLLSLSTAISAEEKTVSTFEKQTSALLRLHEGDEKTAKIRKPYYDSRGFLTVGVGHNLTVNGIPEGIRISENDLKTGLNDQQIEALLQHDVQQALAGLKAEFPWFENLSNIRKIVLLDMCFNLGLDGLKKFKKTLAHIKNGRYEQASKEMLHSLWATQVGKIRSKRLSEMMRTNTWPKEVKT